ncbi:MAG: hypothetical protein KY432_00860 [Acidobacteria bacterium]|nr:hypothetical protein [Acidobacteriota bacterium]
MKNGAMLAFLLLFVATVPLFAQQFDSGSDGSYGPIHVPSSTAVTIDVPLDGIIHATTVTIDHYGSLHFRANELNTPVYLLATGDVTLSTYNTSVSVSGRNAEGVIGGAGGPGGFGGGHGAAAGGSASAGFGPGAGGAGTGPCSDSGGGGAYRTAGSSANVGQPYGSQLLLPLVGGSGGGGLAESAIGGGGGGGAILIASNTQIVINGHISAAGGGGCNASNTNGGSGGAVRLVAPKVIGYGTFQVGSVNVWGASGGGSGRIRVDALQPVSGEVLKAV